MEVSPARLRQLAHALRATSGEVRKSAELGRDSVDSALVEMRGSRFVVHADFTLLKVENLVSGTAYELLRVVEILESAVSEYESADRSGARRIADV
ncbi:hypothetical protein JK358_37425 [Nocardia sp. 2]|uniref:Uncharacterized protein n=1 Tax=Nocardia acididurans TaxID=2802282 RepID=A0ABS1MLB7_9NOCA|nr:hypothetical protein [Nocardia acididurans]MBL1080093.1 hypothetical protein [Nocardia acididurans]